MVYSVGMTTTNTTETPALESGHVTITGRSVPARRTPEGTVFRMDGSNALTNVRVTRATAATFVPDAPAADDREVICSQFLALPIRTSAEPTDDDDPYAIEYDADDYDGQDDER